MKFIAYVTVRLNSKRVKNKSILPIGGKPLIGKCIETLNKVSELDKIILYCSDESIHNYIDNSNDYDFIKRDRKYDSDKTTFNDILNSIIDSIDTDYIVFFSCTSPFIKPETISDIINNVKNNNYDSGFTAIEYKEFAWYNNKPLNYSLDSDVKRTQDLKPIIFETSSVYVFNKKSYISNEHRIGNNPYIKIVDKIEGLDIDTYDDLTIAEKIGNN